MRPFRCTGSLLLALAVRTPALGAGEAGAASESAQATGALALTPAELDFGRFLVGQTLQRQVVIENTSSAKVHLTRIEAPQALHFSLGTERTLRVPVQAEGSLDLELGPGEKAQMDVVFASRGQPAGAWEGSLAISVQGREERATLACKADLVGAVRRPTGPTGADPSTPRPQPTGPQPCLRAEPTEFHLGKLAIGEKAAHVFDFRNEGEGPLSIEGVRASCKCTGRRLWTDEIEVTEEALADRQRTEPVLTLAPGGVAHLEIALATKDMAVSSNPDADLEKIVSLLSNDPEHPSFPLRLRFQLEQLVKIEPPRLTLPEGRRGEPISGSVRVFSPGGEEFRIVAAVAPANSPMEVTFQQVAESGPPAYDVQVRVPPSAPAGRLSGVFTLKLDHPRVEELSFSAFGQVLSQVEFRTGEGESRASLLNFDVMDGTEDVTRVLTIVNHDPAVPYVPTHVELQARRGVEHIQHELVEVQAGVEYRIEVTVGKAMPHRFFDAYLRISSDHPDETLRVVPLRGFVELKTEGSGRRT